MKRIQTDMTLKVDPGPFRAVWRGQKTAELRKNDRGFQVGDRITLIEYDRNERGWIWPYRSVIVEVCHIAHIDDYIARSSELPKDLWVMLSFKVLQKNLGGTRDTKVCQGCRGKRDG